MVWFHGGVFVWGESNDWNPAQLVQKRRGRYTLNPESRILAEVDGEAFAKRAGCADQSAVCLRGLPVATILKYQDWAPWWCSCAGTTGRSHANLRGWIWPNS
jgi:carboxylesterase type B